MHDWRSLLGLALGVGSFCVPLYFVVTSFVLKIPASEKDEPKDRDFGF